MKILFQGDSITDAFRKPEELNPGYQLGNGYAFLVASRLALDNPQIPFSFINRGISGEDEQDLSRRWKQDALDIKPDLLSLLIGVNTTLNFVNRKRECDAASFAKRYTELLTSIRTANPEIRLFLMEPFLLKGKEITTTHCSHLKMIQEVVKRISVEQCAHYIPLQHIFNHAIILAPPEFWAYDGIHPTHAGAQLIADAWISSYMKSVGPK